MARRKGQGVEGLQVCRRRRDRRGPARRGAWIQAAAAARRVDRQDAAARFAPGWNKKKLAELLTNRISLDIFGYIRGGNVPAPKNEGNQMEKEYKCVVCSRYGAKHYRCNKNGCTYWFCKQCLKKFKYPMEEI